MSLLCFVFLFGIPRPVFVSVEAASFQVGAGLAQGWPYDYECGFLFPDFGISAGEARLYWGKTVAFLTGLELFRGEGAYTSSTGVFGTCEVLMLEIGGSALFAPMKNAEPYACLKPLVPLAGNNFVPRFDVVSGLSPVNLLNVINPLRFSPTLRLEAKLVLSPSFRISLENRYIFASDEYSAYWSVLKTFHLSLCLALSNDYLIPFKASGIE